MITCSATKPELLYFAKPSLSFPWPRRGSDRAGCWGARQDQGTQEGFPQLRECMYPCSDRVTCSKSISKCTWIGRKRGRYLLHLHQGIFPSWCLGLCALSYRQPLTASLSALSDWEDDQGRKSSLRNLFVPFPHEAASPCLLETI